MRPRGLKKYAIGAGGMLMLVVGLLLATGWGSAVAAQITSVVVTNDTAHPVPVHEQGTASVNVTSGQLTAKSAATPTTRTVSGEGFADLVTIVPAVPAGQRFILKNLLAITNPADPTNPPTDGYCELRLNPTGTVEAAPLRAPASVFASGELALDEQQYLVVAAGQSLEVRCGASTDSFWNVTASGDYEPAP
jgi:hypothetical protein